jgi:hypothetical protein
MKPTLKNQIFFTFTDLRQLFLRHRSRIKAAALMGGLLAVVLLSLRGPQYKVESTFKQMNRQGDLTVNAKEIFQHLMTAPTESGMIAVMQSNEVIKAAVEELGMQVIGSPDSFIIRIAKRIRDSFWAEFGGRLSDPDKFSFVKVSYSGEVPLAFFLKLDEGGSYQLYDSNKQLLGEEKLGGQVSIPFGRLTLSRVPNHAAPNRFYSLIVNPLISTIEGLRFGLKMTPHKLDKTILQFTFFCRDRLLGAEFVNQLMLSYQTYLKQENDAICQEQLRYLEQREQELTGHYDKALQEHSAYLQENLAKNGFIGFAQEIETLSQPKNFYTSKLFDVDLELRRLRDSRETLAPLKGDKSQLSIVPVNEAILLLKGIEGIAKPQVWPQMDFCNSLERDEFSGLNLATAQGLLVEYTRQRDSLQAQIRESVFLREQLGKSGFEMSSLGGVFDDGVIKDLVGKASQIALQLKDENNRSTREQERLIEALNTQKNFLSHYLFQTVELKRLRLKLFADKIISLQQATLALLQSEKDLLKNKLQELNGKMGDLPEKWRRESLLTLKKEIGAMMLEGVSQLVETKSLGQHTFQTASKPLDKAFPPLSPKPPKILLLSLVAAFFSGLGCYFLVFCKALIKGLPSSDETLRVSGFPVSGRISAYCNTDLSQIQQKDLETLRHLLNFLTARNTGPAGMVAICIGGKCPDYSLPLAELLAMRGLQVLVIQCVFDKVVHSDEMPGLWQYLQGQTPDLPLQHRATYDLLTTGSTSRYGTEILCSLKFKELLCKFKQRYDIVLLYCSAEPVEVEGLSLLKIADAALITVQQENKDDLEIYCEWAEQKGGRSVTFIYAEEFA